PRMKKTAANRRLAQWRVKWLIEHSTSHQLLWCIDSLVLRNPPLRQAPNRCSEIPPGFRYIARRLCRPKPFQGLRTSEGFAKCKTLRKASGRYMQALKNRSFKNQIQMKKNILIISFFLIANSIFAQKVYKVDCVSWIYEKPENYNYQTDNFSEIVNLGESFLNNEKNLNLNPEEDILFSITKEENVNFN